MLAATLKTNEFSRAAKNCSEIFSKYFVIRAKKHNIENSLSYGIVISNKVAKSCVRNKLKRQFRAIINNYSQTQNTSQIVIIYAKKTILNASYNDLEKDFAMQMKKILKKFN